jgi:hypothetical protein
LECLLQRHESSPEMEGEDLVYEPVDLISDKVRSRGAKGTQSMYIPSFCGDADNAGGLGLIGGRPKT